MTGSVFPRCCPGKESSSCYSKRAGSHCGSSCSASAEQNSLQFSSSLLEQLAASAGASEAFSPHPPAQRWWPLSGPGPLISGLPNRLWCSTSQTSSMGTRHFPPICQVFLVIDNALFSHPKAYLRWSVYEQLLLNPQEEMTELTCDLLSIFFL